MNNEAWNKAVHKAEESHWWFKARRSIIDHLFLNSLSKKSSLRILSIGIGAATELSYLSRFGQVEGLEIDEAHVKIGQEKGFTVHHQDITQCTLPDETYDIVFAMDVLEHIEDDKKAFENIMRLLKKGGTLVATVPAFQFLWSKSDELNYHKRRYNKPLFKQLVTAGNASIKKCSYYNFFLFPILVMRRFFFPTGGESEIEVPGKIVNTALYVLFQAEKWILKYISFPWGGSLLALIEKK